MPHSSLAAVSSLLKLTNRDKRRKIKFAPQHILKVIHTLWKLKDQVKPNKTFTENHYRMFINIQTLSQFENIILKQVNNILCKSICISFTSLYCWLQFQQEDPIINWIKISEICLKLSELTVQVTLFVAHFKVRDKYVFQNDCWNCYHALFLVSLIG